MKRVLIGLLTLSWLSVAMPVSAERSSDAGTPCTTLGKQFVIAGKRYTCVKSGGKLVLNKGVTVAPQTTATTTSPSATVTSTSPSTTVARTTTSTTMSNLKLTVGSVDPATGGTVIADAGQGKTISVGKTSGRYVVVVPVSCGYRATWNTTVKSGYSCGGKSDWDVPTLKMYFNYIFPVVDPPGGDYWTREVGTETDVSGVYSGLMIRNINGRGAKNCPDIFSCSGGADKSNSLTVLPVRAYTP